MGLKNVAFLASRTSIYTFLKKVDKDRMPYFLTWFGVVSVGMFYVLFFCSNKSYLL